MLPREPRSDSPDRLYEEIDLKKINPEKKRYRKISGKVYNIHMKKILDLIEEADCVASFTGAGISTLCGIPDFRGPQGLYKQPDAERIFDIDWFERDPSIYYRGCAELVYGLKNFKPGPVHIALTALEKAGKMAGVITQNIDMLHQKAGSSNVMEIHGSPLLHHCWKCGHEAGFESVCAQLENGKTVAVCEKCGGPYKPDITFFGESLPETAWSRAISLTSRADLMLVLGTSLTVNPASMIPQYTLHNGGKVVIVNAQPTPLDRLASAVFPDLKEFAEGIAAFAGSSDK